jgi:hypothetical protein
MMRYKQPRQLDSHDRSLIQTGVMSVAAGVKRKTAPEDTAEAVKRTKVDDIQETSDGTCNRPSSVMDHLLTPRLFSRQRPGRRQQQPRPERRFLDRIAYRHVTHLDSTFDAQVTQSPAQTSPEQVRMRLRRLYQVLLSSCPSPRTPTLPHQ